MHCVESHSFAGRSSDEFQPASLSAMNSEAKPSFRKDALVVTLAMGALGLLWILFRLYWQGLVLLLASGAVAYLGFWRSKARAQAQVKPSAVPPAKRERADGPRRGKKRRRRK